MRICHFRHVITEDVSRTSQLPRHQTQLRHNFHNIYPFLGVCKQKCQVRGPHPIKILLL